MWKNEYRKMMFPENGDKIKYEQALKLKYANIPSKLYKYCKIADYTFENIESKLIRVSPLNSMNDPQECPFYFDDKKVITRKPVDYLQYEGMGRRIRNCNLTKEQLNSMSYKEMFFTLANDDDEFRGDIKKIKRAYEEIERVKAIEIDRLTVDFSDEYRATTFIYSMTTDVNNNLMWSHYAEKHSGICLEFDFSSCETSDSLKYAIQPVLYQNDKIEATNYKLKNDKPNKYAGLYFSLIKSNDWKYEDEWRLVYINPTKMEPYFIESPKIIGIYMGSKISEINKRKVIDFAEKHKINLYQLNLNPRSFIMKKDPIKTF